MSKRVSAAVARLGAALQLPDYAALRAYSGPRKSVYVTGVLGTAAPSGIAGMFVRHEVAGAVDNGGTRIVGQYVWDRAFDGSLMGEWFGAKGDGVTNDRAAINVCYAAARLANMPVHLRGGAKYFISGGNVDARGASTIGNGATLDISILPSADQAFLWGGSDTFVEGVVFELSNPDTTQSVQGIFNNTNDAKNQRFSNNRVISKTRRASNSRSNIYGVWFSATGIDGLQIVGNHIEATDYGIQINNMAVDWQNTDVNTAPLGNPSRGVRITDNMLKDSLIGINTPHIMLSDLYIERNTIWQSEYIMDLPLNVAHAINVHVTNNTVSCNAAAANGTVHFEDVIGRATISGNTIKVSAANHGIFFGIASGVSKDAETASRTIITNNIIEGPGAAIANTQGILFPDNLSIDNVVSGNHIRLFETGIFSSSENQITDNTVTDCTYAFQTLAHTGVEANTVKRCTYVTKLGGRALSIHGGIVYADDLAIDLTGGGQLHINNVLLRKVTVPAITAGTPFDVVTLPNGKFKARVLISFGGLQGFTQHEISFDGTTFTATRVSDYQIGSLGGITLSKSGSKLQATVSAGSHSNARQSVTLDGFVYRPA